MNATAIQNPLALDLEAEFHSHLLREGNLFKKKQWGNIQPETWAPGPNVARISEYSCANCGTLNKTLIGLFSTETRGENQKREKAIQSIPESLEYNLEIHHLPDQPICPHCL